LPEKKKSNLELLVVENKWLSCFVVENMTFGRLSININSETTGDWLPCFYYPGFQSLRDVSIYYLVSKALESRVCFYKLTYEVEKDNFHLSFKVFLYFSITYNSLIYVIAT
jgi:hypothetical protein